MRNKTAHAKILSMLLALVMVLSSVAVFAEGEENAAAGEPTVTTQEDQNVETTDQNNNGEAVDAVDEAAETDVTLDTQEEEVSISLDKTTAEIVVGNTVTLTATTVPEDATVTWTASNDKATVEGGVVTGVAAGEVIITASIEGAEATCTVNVKDKPAAPTGVKATIRYGKGDNGLTVEWDAVTDADSYIVMRGTSKSNLKNYKTTTKTSVYWLEAKGTYYYAVKAVKDGVESDPSSDEAKASITGNILPTIQELTWYSHTKKTVTLYRTAKLKGKVAKLPKGTYVQAIGKSPKKVKKFKQPSKVQVRAKVNGRTVVGWVKYKQLRGGVKAATTVSQDYTQSALEYFVNGHGYSSPNKYLIWVSPRTQRAYLFTGEKGQWKLSKRFRVTTGRFSHKTAPYHSAISKKKDKVWMVTEKGKRYYYKTASYFASGVSFHTGTWWANGKVRGVMNKAGKPQTFGCLRMANGDAGWIYKYVPVGTTVIVKKDAA